MTSQEFKVIRLRLGLTQTELGDLMGMTQQSVQRVESKRQPTRVHEAFIRLVERYLKITKGASSDKIQSID